MNRTAVRAIGLFGLATLTACSQAAPPAPAPLTRTAADQPLVAERGMVVSASAIASDVGGEVLRKGGNAVDAAIATGLALAVTYPGAGNIGGGGFMVIRFPDGRTTALDFRERAPLAAHPDMFLRDGTYDPDLHHEGHRSVGVPGTVAGLDKAHKLYGTVPWERAVYPSVRLAEEGFPLSETQASALTRLVERARRSGYTGTLRAFARDGVAYQAGEIHQQPDLARTLG